MENRVADASKILDNAKKTVIERLITYSAEVRKVSEGLDSLFPDIPKEFSPSGGLSGLITVNFGTFTRTLSCDSLLERTFAAFLARAGYIKDIKAQCIELSYCSMEMENKRYFPDFVFVDYADRLAIVEMKNLSSCSYHLNLDKYERLKEFCEENGFGYAMVMKSSRTKSYISAEQIKAAPLDRRLEEYILNLISERGTKTGYGCFTAADMDEYKVKFGEVSEISVHTILMNNRTLKNLDKFGAALAIESH